MAFDSVYLPMMRFLSFFLAVMFCQAALANINITYTVTDFGISTSAVKRVTITPIAKAGDYSGNFLVPSPMLPDTFSGGVAVFSNKVPGYAYSVKFETTFATTARTNFFPTGLSGNVNGRDYLAWIVGFASDGSVLQWAWLYQTNLSGILDVGGYATTNYVIAYLATNSTQTNITYTAVTNVPASRLLGRTTVGTGAAEVITVGSGLTLASGILSLYVAPTITSFTNDQNSLEQGATVSDTVLGWTLGGGSINEQYLNQGIGLLSDSERFYTDPANYTSSRSYTLTVTDGTTTNTANTSITFYSKAYWGDSSDPTPDDATLLAMSQEFATSRARTKTITVAGEHIIVAYPASFGTASFRVNGFLDTAWTLEVRNVVNASGASVSYNVYHSNEPGLGTFTVEVF